MKVRIYLLLTLIIATVVASCASDAEMDFPQGNTEVSFELLVPGHIQSTRKIDMVNENFISEIDILVFKESGGDELFQYSIPLTLADIKNITASGNKKLITINLSPSLPGEKIRIVAIANAHSLIPAIGLNQKKEDVLNIIQFSVPGTTWKVNSGFDYTPFSMWGESGLIELDINKNITPIQLLRTVAKIDVGLNYVQNEPQGLSNFKLDKVYLFNANSNGYLLPDPANYNRQWKYVVAPSIPSPNGKTEGPFTFTAESQKQVLNSIYVAEMEAMTPATRNSAAYLVVEGEYEGSTTFYRIDFIRYNGVNKEYIPILRNYIYRFNISYVQRAGVGSLNDAKTSHAMNDYITYTLDVQDESTSTDGKSYLNVSKDKLSTPYLNAKTWSIDVETNAASWSIVDKDSWITVSPTSGVGNIRNMVNVDIASNSTQRSGSFTIKAGNITKVVNVDQRYSETVPANYSGYNNTELEVYIYDQPEGCTWQHYANFPDDFFSSSEAPFPTHMQVSPPRPYSCAALDAGGHSDWRMPNIEELNAMSKYAIDNNGQKIFDFKLDNYFPGSGLSFYWIKYLSASSLNPRWEDNYPEDVRIYYHNNSEYTSASAAVAGSMIRTDDYGASFYIYEGYKYNAEYQYNSGIYSPFEQKGGALNFNSNYFRYSSNNESQWNLYYYNSLKGRISSGVRCVRSNTPPTKAIHNIPDASTGLGYDLYIMPWDQEEVLTNREDGGEYIYYYMNRTPGDAGGILPNLTPPHKASCDIYNTYSYGGRNNWRVPTVMELKKMFDYLDTPQKLIAHGFPNFYSTLQTTIGGYRLSYVSSDISYDNISFVLYNGVTFVVEERSLANFNTRSITTRCVSND